MRSVALRSGILVLAALCLVAGCHQADRNVTRKSPLATSAERTGPRQNANVQVAMGRTAEQSGDLDTAMAAYNAALKNDPHRADANQRLAVVHDRLGRFQESAAYYAKALAEGPGDAEIFCDKGYSLYLQRSWADADVCLRQSIALNPKLARAHNNLGLLLVKDEKIDEALAEFRAAGCRPAEAHQNVAFVLSTEKRFDLARRHYELALAADPSSTIARDRLAELGKVADKVLAQSPTPRRDAAVMTTSASLEKVGDVPAPTSQNRRWFRGRRTSSSGSINAKDRANEVIDSPR
jgi:Tfp pilus assembly protein PilF